LRVADRPVHSSSTTEDLDSFPQTRFSARIHITQDRVAVFYPLTADCEPAVAGVLDGRLAENLK
jgi:hypothetical protein